jgi:pimeloyl-ACP methyl ester carboxylesterase
MSIAVTLNHVRRGKGEPLLLIHGIGGEWGSWEPLLDRLSAERDVVAVDVPGFGDSPPLPAGRRPNVPALAEASAGFVREQVAAEPIDVAGHSMGGWIGLELAKLGVARRVVPVAPAGFWTRAEAEYGRAVLRLTAWLSRNQAELLERGFARPRARAMLIGGQFGFPARVPSHAVRRMNQALASSPGYDDTLAAMNSERFSGGQDVRVPVTVVWGTRDRLLPPRQAARAVREIPGAELEWVDGGGHFAHWDGQDLVARVVLGR